MYHALRDPRGFRSIAASAAVFLPVGRVRAYLERMPCARRTTILVALAVALAVSSASATTHAAYGKVNANIVRQKIRNDLPKINRCYESALRYEPELAGKVKVRFAVVRKGHVQAIQVLENTTGHAGVERCVTRVVNNIKFPTRRSGKPLSFTFPFIFAPQ